MYVTVTDYDEIGGRDPDRDREGPGKSVLYR
jgi:hypothetical protein